MMRKSLIAMFVVVLVLTAAPAHASVPRVYKGRTSQEQGLVAAFSKRSSGALRLDEIRLKELDLTCSIDGSTESWGIGALWLPGLPLDGRTLTLAAIWLSTSTPR
jgi:hypothetical protein